MRILHINCNYIGTHLHRKMIEHLNDLGVTNTVYVPVCEKEKEDVTTRGSEVVVSKCFQKWHRIFFDYKQWRIMKDLQKRLDCTEYDCIHAYTLFTDGNCARKIARKNKIPYVVAIRDTDVNTFLKKAFYLRPRAVKILKDAAAIFFLSDNYRKQVFEQYVPQKLRAEFYSKSYVVPNGIDEFWLNNCCVDYDEDVEKAIGANMLRVISVGVINRRKNHLATQQALELLRKRGWSVRFQIVGKILDQALFEEIMSYPDTEYIPQQPKEKLLEYYRENDLFVMPSITETFGLVYAEALTQGLPVIYTKGQGFDGQFEEGIVGYAVDSNSPQEIAQKIEEAIRNYKKLRKNGIQLVRKFDWKDICGLYRDIYLELMRQK